MSILTEQAWICFFITVSLAVIFCAWKQKRIWKFFLISFLTYYFLTFCNTVFNLTDGIIGTTDILNSSAAAIGISITSLIFFYLFRLYKEKANSFIDDPHKSRSLKIKFFLLFLCVFAIFVTIFSPAFYTSSNPSDIKNKVFHKTYATARMNYTYNFLYALFDSTQSFEGESFEEKLAEQTKNSDQSLWEDFSALIQKEGLFTKEEFERKFGKDLWRNRYNIDYTTNLTGLPENLSEYLSKYPIVIWSNGRNRINERCLGDDIFWPVDSNFNPSDSTYRNLLKSKKNLLSQPTAE